MFHLNSHDIPGMDAKASQYQTIHHVEPKLGSSRALTEIRVHIRLAR